VRKKALSLSIVLLLAACLPSPTVTPSVVPPQPSATSPAATLAPTATLMPAATSTPAPTPTLMATNSPAPTHQPLEVAPYPEAPLCPDTGNAHDQSLFHTLWDATRGCHYDHEHGQNPFTPRVAEAFPGFDLRALLGGVGVGHTNPSSPMENTHKHGGFKWDVTLAHSAGCAGREGAPTGVDALVIQYHAFGDYSIEFEARVHSAVALMRQCQVGNPTDYGYVFANQHQDYGQRVAPYQGGVLPYADTPLPAYDPAREPYFAVHCHGGTFAPCDKYASRQAILNGNRNTNSTWISEPNNVADTGSSLFFLLFRLRDSYQSLNASDQSYPFTFDWMCSADDGMTFDAVPGCRWNNTTTRVHEVGGEIPEAWDNLADFDTDPRLGRITAEGYVTHFGQLAPDCTSPGPDCHPLKLVQAFTGQYGAGFDIPIEPLRAFHPRNLPERDIYFCDGVQCAEDDRGAVPSGWVGPTN
jgi:hypothetical protein